MSKNKRKTVAEKVSIIAEAKAQGAIETARKHGISHRTLLDWQQQHESGGDESLASKTSISNADYKKLLLENSRLKELVADKELQLKIQGEFLKKK
jgi:transposase-like protein